MFTDVQCVLVINIFALVQIVNWPYISMYHFKYLDDYRRVAVNV